MTAAMDTIISYRTRRYLLVTWTLFLVFYWLVGLPLGVQFAYVYP